MNQNHKMRFFLFDSNNGGSYQCSIELHLLKSDSSNETIESGIEISL